MVHVSLPYVSVLTTQALHTTILAFAVNLGWVHTREVKRAGVVAAFPILLSISAFKEGMSVMAEPICELFNDVELIFIDGDGRQFHCILPKDVGLFETDG